MAGLRLVAGLGNPGRQYRRTRHNAGFFAVDALAERWGVGQHWKTKDGARQVLAREPGVLLVEPQTFMNASGEPLQRIAAWHRILPQNMLVIVDDLDLPFGKLRLRERGSSGGHNGLKSIIEQLGSDFARLRIGIGRSADGEAIDRVLGAFSADEEILLPDIVTACVEGTELWLSKPMVTAVTFVNNFKLGV